MELLGNAFKGNRVSIFSRVFIRMNVFDVVCVVVIHHGGSPSVLSCLSSFIIFSAVDR